MILYFNFGSWSLRHVFGRCRWTSCALWSIQSGSQTAKICALKEAMPFFSDFKASWCTLAKGAYLSKMLATVLTGCRSLFLTNVTCKLQIWFPLRYSDDEGIRIHHHKHSSTMTCTLALWWPKRKVQWAPCACGVLQMVSICRWRPLVISTASTNWSRASSLLSTFPQPRRAVKHFTRA